MEGKKELIWVPVELKDKIEKMDTDIEKLKIVNDYIEQKKFDITSDIESLDDDLLRLKAFALKYKTEFERICEEQGKQLEIVYEKCYEQQNNTIGQVKRVKSILDDTLADISKIQTKLDNISTYRIEKLLELIERFTRMSDEEKKFFQILIDSQ